MRFVIIALILTNALWFALYQRQTAAYQALVKQSLDYYSDARGNEHELATCNEQIRLMRCRSLWGLEDEDDAPQCEITGSDLAVTH